MGKECIRCGGAWEGFEQYYLSATTTEPLEHGGVGGNLCKSCWVAFMDFMNSETTYTCERCGSQESGHAVAWIGGKAVCPSCWKQCQGGAPEHLPERKQHELVPLKVYQANTWVQTMSYCPACNAVFSDRVIGGSQVRTPDNKHEFPPLCPAVEQETNG